MNLETWEYKETDSLDETAEGTEQKAEEEYILSDEQCEAVIQMVAAATRDTIRKEYLDSYMYKNRFCW